MNLCSEGHDEICYGGRTCPACELLETIQGLEAQIAGLEEEIKELKTKE